MDWNPFIHLQSIMLLLSVYPRLFLDTTGTVQHNRLCRCQELSDRGNTITIHREKSQTTGNTDQCGVFFSGSSFSHVHALSSHLQYDQL
jgi:hypothetical protein